MNFADVLNTSVESVERPPLVPPGTYVTSVRRIDFGSLSDGKWETVDFLLGFISAMENVDQDELVKYGPLTSTTRRHRFMFNTESTDEAKQQNARTQFNLKTFLTGHLGLPPAGSFKELIASAMNQQCLADVNWRPDPRNPEIIYDEIKRTAPLA